MVTNILNNVSIANFELKMSTISNEIRQYYCIFMGEGKGLVK